MSRQAGQKPKATTRSGSERRHNAQDQWGLKHRTRFAQMVKLVDTLASGASARKGVEVQVLFWAPFYKKADPLDRLFCSRTRNINNSV